MLEAFIDLVDNAWKTSMTLQVSKQTFQDSPIFMQNLTCPAFEFLENLQFTARNPGFLFSGKNPEFFSFPVPGNSKLQNSWQAFLRFSMNSNGGNNSRGIYVGK